MRLTALCHNLALQIIDDATPIAVACAVGWPEKIRGQWAAELSDRIQNTIECYLQEIEQEDREAERKRKEHDEALAEEAGEARAEMLREEREGGRG